MSRTRPFARYEFLIAWRYLRARRAEGGVSVMTWISLIGIALGVMALIATLAVRAGFRSEFVDTIVGANAHVSVYLGREVVAEDVTVPGRIRAFDEMAARLAAVPGVARAVPVVRGQAMASQGDASALADVRGLTAEQLAAMPRIADPETSMGRLSDFGETVSGIAVGVAMARELGVGVGDQLRLIQPNGARTAFGTSPRINGYTVVYIFEAGRYDIDLTRAYLPLAEAQSFFNREGVVDEIEVISHDPENIDALLPALYEAAGPGAQIWTWRDGSRAFLSALDMEDDVMFVILSVLVLIAAMNITSGLIMLVKNKGRDIGILRTMGLTEGSVMRVFFLCGAFTGVIGTALGVFLGVILALNVENIMALLNSISDGGAWQPEVRGIYRLPAELRAWDIGRAVALSLGLSLIVTIFPARRAARLNPVEALRYE